MSLNLKKGETYSTISKANTVINQMINDQPLDISMTITGKMSYKVIGIRDSLYDMTAQYDSLGFTMKMPNGELSSSSEKIDSSNIFGLLMSKLKNKPFKLTMSKTGKISQVDGVEKMIDGLIAGMGSKLNDAQRAQMKSQMSNSFGTEAFRTSMEVYLTIFPGAKVAKDAKWVIDTKLKSTMVADVHTTYTLKDVTDQYYLIAGDATIKTDPKTPAATVNGFLIKYNMAGTNLTEIKADKKTGWITEAHVVQNIKGNNEIQDNPQIPGGMTIPMTMNTNMTITDK
ncbi:hypothetical protein GCM10023149_42730 [Mucilaginibacter gynuensis]|uniref:Uncharacterized protein n=1 Tax=Mucilaginibacter gynuensis TaxID=1302236 RepID=A0ABP8H6D5_9SPHI